MKKVKNKKPAKPKSFRKRKPVLEEQPTLTKPLQAAFIVFLQQHSPKSFSKNLRRMMIEYVMDDNGRSSIYLYETLAALYCLFDLLDVAEEEWR